MLVYERNSVDADVYTDLVRPPLELLPQGHRALHRDALLVQAGLTLAAGGASLSVERGPIQPASLSQPQDRLALTQQLRVTL